MPMVQLNDAARALRRDAVLLRLGHTIRLFWPQGRFRRVFVNVDVSLGFPEGEKKNIHEPGSAQIMTSW